MDAGDTLQRIAVRDGRCLAISEFGIPGGSPVLYFHGFPASRLEARLAHRAAVVEGVRLIAIDRPGCGQSDFRGSRTLADWPHDVAAVADAMGLERFAIIGVSGGAPYALACAAALPLRVRAVAIVGGLSMTSVADDFNQLSAAARASFRLARASPRMSRLVNRMLIRLLRRRPELVFGLLSGRMSAADRAALAEGETAGMLAASLREALRAGSEGPSHELQLYARPWDFDVASIRVPCYVWHGEQDRTVPAQMGRRIAALVPGCRATFLPDEGHFSLPLRHTGVVLRALLQHR